MATKIEFKRGDGITHYFKMPASSWSAGGTLFFAAKEAVDNDATDAAAVIDVSFTDSVVADETIDGVAYKTYTCYFAPADTGSINLGGKSEKKYKGEFQWVSSGGVPSTFPGGGTFLDAIVYADIKRATS